MSAFPSNDLRGAGGMVLMLAALMFMPSAAFAVIVFDGHVRVAAEPATHGLQGVSSAGYSLARSHAWMNYRNSTGQGIGSGRGLIEIPLRGGWTASSASQTSARVNVARAQAYRMGGRE